MQGDGTDSQGDSSDSGVTPADEAYCPSCNRSYFPDLEWCPIHNDRLVFLTTTGDPLLGATLDGRYVIQAIIGRGGMGTVYRGVQRTIDRPVAIKVVRDKLSHDRASAKRFLREARLVSQLNHASIVSVYDFGQTNDGLLYLVMELLRGRTLAQELRRRSNGGLPPARACRILLQLCDALIHAHETGIVHRDLKPMNIFMLAEPPERDLVKVLDFGVAKSLVTNLSTVTKVGEIVGTPRYMAPETIQKGESDARSDLYSLGCILFELLTGAPPFVDPSPTVLTRHVSEPAPLLPSSFPERLRALGARLLEKEPQQRPSSAAEVRQIVELALGETTDGATYFALGMAEGSRSGTSSDPEAEVHSASLLEDESGAAAERPLVSKRARYLRWLAVSTSLVVLTIGGLVWLGDGSTPTVASPDALSTAGASLGGLPAATATSLPVDAGLAPPVTAASPDAGLEPLDAAASPDATPAPVRPESASGERRRRSPRRPTREKPEAPDLPFLED